MAIIAFDPEIPVFDRFARSYPQYVEGEPATYGPISEACQTAFGWDAHFAAYSCVTIPRRLGTAAALAYKPKMVLLVLDVDGPDHRCTPEWWAVEVDKVQAFFKKYGRGYCYTTKGGYRIILGLRDELTLATVQDALRWRFSYLEWIAKIQAEFGIICDDKCADWTRCFRLPRVTRDGNPTVPVHEIGRVDRLLEWREPYIPVDDPRLTRTDVSIDIPEPAPVTPEQLEASAEALIKAWPPRSRHYAGMALCGALAKSGWSEGAIADFVCYVMWRTVGDPEEPKWSKQARDVLDKLHRSEQVTGWATLVDLMCTGADGQRDENRRPTVDAAVLEARRAINQAPPIELFDQVRAEHRPAIAATDVAGIKALLSSAIAEPGQTTAELRAEMAADAAVGGFSNPNLLDDAATDLPPIIQEAESKSTTVNPNRMGMTYKQMRARNLPPPEYLIAGLIPKEGVGALSGEPKAAKSWDATYYAVCVAAGVPVFGQHAVQRPARVFYYYAEDTEAAVNNRVGAIATSLNLDPNGEWTERLVMQPRGRSLDVMNTAQLCVLAASVRDFEKPGDKFALLILDPLSNIHSGEEDKRDSMVKVMARLHALEQYLGLAILFIHHSGKENADTKGRKRGGQKMRGSSAIHGAVDFGIYLSNLRGDSKHEFIARVESEMKAARGAGMFDRTLLIDDNDKGNAIKATFSVSDAADIDEGPQDLASERALDIVKKLFDQGAPLTHDALKKKIGGKGAILTKAIDIACAEGWIAQKYNGKHSQGYEITEKGCALIRDGGGSGGGESEDPTPPAPPPASSMPPGFLASWIAQT